MIESSALIGVWHLARWGRSDNGGPIVPFDGSKGRLFYTADGFVAAQLERAPTSGESQKLFFGYSGTWRTEADMVHHDVDLATVPEFIGATLRRDVLVIDAGRLHLRTPPMGGAGTDIREILEWVRAHV